MNQDTVIWALLGSLVVVAIVAVLLVIEGLRIRAVAVLLARYVLHIAIESGSTGAWELVGRARQVEVLDNEDYQPPTSLKG